MNILNPRRNRPLIEAHHLAHFLAVCVSPMRVYYSGSDVPLNFPTKKIIKFMTNNNKNYARNVASPPTCLGVSTRNLHFLITSIV